MSMNRIIAFFGVLFLTSCAVSPLVTNQYSLDKYSSIRYKTPDKHTSSIYIGTPEAIAGIQTDQMLYTMVPHEVSTFVHNTWKNPPADMLYPLIQQSIQDSQYFRIVASGSHAEICHYRLDVELLDFKQNFLKRPSHIDFLVKVMLTDTTQDKVITTKLIRESVRCPSDNPYGGVLAANQATEQLTRRITAFVVSEVKHYRVTTDRAH